MYKGGSKEEEPTKWYLPKENMEKYDQVVDKEKFSSMLPPELCEEEYNKRIYATFKMLLGPTKPS